MAQFTLHTHLQNYASNYAEEIEYKSKMQHLLFKSPLCYSRELLEGHFTASAFIINKNKTKTLLVKHRKLNKWLQPGGHCDGDENLLHVALKEVNEETGLEDFEVKNEIFDLDIHLIPERKGIPAHLHYDVRFLLIAGENSSLKISDESVDLQWIPIENLAEYNNERSLLRMAEKIH